MIETKLLNNYSTKLVELQLFKNNNAKVFNKLEKLQTELTKIETQLKLEVKNGGKDIENDIVSVKISERYSKYYDYAAFLGSANEEEIVSLEEAKGIIREIDKDIFNELVEQNLITRVTKLNSFREKLLNTAILIKSKL